MKPPLRGKQLDTLSQKDLDEEFFRKYGGEKPKVDNTKQDKPQTNSSKPVENTSKNASPPSRPKPEVRTTENKPTVEKETPKEKITPRGVLYEELSFYRDKANKIGNQIGELLKTSDKSHGDLLFQLYKLMLKNKEMLVDVAAKLAPYEHAKLESVEVKSTIEHRFVIRAPQQIVDKSKWLEACGVEDTSVITVDHKPKLLAAMDHIPKKTFADSKKISDAEIIDNDYVDPDDRFN